MSETNAAPTAPASVPANVDQIIGANVHALMWRAHESQSHVAPLWGMGQAALSLKLRGRRPWFASEIDAAARRYGVSRDSLFDEEGPKSGVSGPLLPDLDSNQEPAGFSLGLVPPAETEKPNVIDIGKYRRPSAPSQHARHAQVTPIGMARATVNL